LKGRPSEDYRGGLPESINSGKCYKTDLYSEAAWRLIPAECMVDLDSIPVNGLNRDWPKWILVYPLQNTHCSHANSEPKMQSPTDANASAYDIAAVQGGNRI
jgi:hypothetical protein